MTKRLNPKWKDEQLQKIQDFINDKIPTACWTLTDPLARKWLVYQLVNKKIAFKSINHGSGVWTITTDVDIYPKCGGAGRV